VQAENLTIFSGFAPIAMSFLAIFVTVLIGVIIIGVGVLIAVELTVATLQATFSVPIAVWTLGFAGAPATAPIATAAWGAVLRVIIRFIAILAMAALAIQIVTNWEGTLAATTFNNVAEALNNTGLMITSIELMFGALALAYLTMNLPKLAVAAASGAPAISGVRLVAATGDSAGSTASSVSRGAQQSARGAEAGGSGERTGDGAAAAAGLARGGLAGAAAAVIANRRK
jgi:large-conductance mechanosensitive channel